jgi:DNA-directed RNA polymerase
MKLEEREEFAMNSIENVFDSADHPLDVFSPEVYC